MPMLQSPLQQKAQEAIEFVREIKSSDGAKLFAGVGFPLPNSVAWSLPYAIIITDHYCDTFDLLMKHNERDTLRIVNVLCSVPEIKWVGSPRYQVENGQIYTLIRFKVSHPSS